MLVWAHFTPDPYQMPYVCFCRPAGYPQGQAVPTSESLPPPAAHLQGHEQPPTGSSPIQEQRGGTSQLRQKRYEPCQEVLREESCDNCVPWHRLDGCAVSSCWDSSSVPPQPRGDQAGRV